MGLKDSLRKAAREAARRTTDARRHRHYNLRARATLAAIESERGRTEAALMRRCDEYAGDVLGSRVYAPWLQVYTAVAGQFLDGWIPDNYYGMVVEPAKSGEVAKVAILKTFTNRVLDTEALPDLAYAIDGIYYDRRFRPIPAEALADLLFADNEMVFFKADNSYQGRSVTLMARRDLPGPDARRLPDGVFQAPIRQHPFFAEISPRATATVRITTTREPDGGIAARAAYLRVGRATDAIVRSISHVRVPVDLHQGTLGSEGFLHDWRRTTSHPDTGFRFDGQPIPAFTDAVALCEALHRSCPHIGCLGWDLCIDPQGAVRLMEWNARYNDIKFSEATVGPCFRGLGWEDLWKRGSA